MNPQLIELIHGPLYRWRNERGLSGWDIAEAVADIHGKGAAHWAQIYYPVEKGQDDPQSNEMYPIWQWIWLQPGGEGLDVRMVAWIAKEARAGR